MSEVKYETAREAEHKAEGQGRAHRVGTITCGLLFVLYGVLFLLHIIVPKVDYRLIFDLWPLILISLGVEILLSCMRKKHVEQKIVYDFPAILLVMFLTLFVTVMAVVDYGITIGSEWSSWHFYDYSSSYFSQYAAEEHDGKEKIRGRAYLAENDAMLEMVTAKRETTITVTGYMGRTEGDVRLLYRAEDGVEILIAEGDGSFDKSVTIPAGEGNICFAGYGGKAVCDFDIEILWGDDIFRNAESMESIEDIETVEARVPEMEEVPEIREVPAAGEVSEALELPEVDKVPAAENMESPIVDNWPESIWCDSEGLYAGLCEFPITIEEPMDLSLSYITEDGSLSMWIEDAGGRKYFDEKDIQTDSYEITIDKAGTYTVFFQAKYFYGSFVIEPVE